MCVWRENPASRASFSVLSELKQLMTICQYNIHYSDLKEKKRLTQKRSTSKQGSCCDNIPDHGIQAFRTGLGEQFGKVWRWRLESIWNATQVIGVGAPKTRMPIKMPATVNHGHTALHGNKNSAGNCTSGHTCHIVS